MKKGAILIGLALALLGAQSWAWSRFDLSLSASHALVAGAIVWLCLSLAALGTLYLAQLRFARVGALLKERLALRLVLLPLILLSHLSLLLFHLLGKEDTLTRVDERLWLGGRPLAWHAPALRRADVAAVLDLTAELHEPRFVRKLTYRPIPLLDGTAPTEHQLEEGVAWVIEALERGGVLVHCGVGHGRSALYVAAVQLARGRVDRVDDAIEQLRSVRPGVALAPSQRQVLEAFQRRLAEEPSNG